MHIIIHQIAQIAPYIGAVDVKYSIDIIALVIAIGSAVGIWTKTQTALTALETQQEERKEQAEKYQTNVESRMDALQSMISNQIEVDNAIKDVLHDVKISLARMEEKQRK